MKISFDIVLALLLNLGIFLTTVVYVLDKSSNQDIRWAGPSKEVAVLSIVPKDEVAAPSTYSLRFQAESENMAPKYVQRFPIERYPGMKCYVLVSNLRYVVLSYNCNPIYVESDTITIGNIVLKRNNPGENTNLSYRNDYTDIVAFLLFGSPVLGIQPLAPKGFVLLENDCVICNKALDNLDRCFQGQYNCYLGVGLTFNFFAGASTEQPNPEQFRDKRFTKVEDILFVSQQHDTELLLKEINRDGFRGEDVNRVEGFVGHENEELMACEFSDSLVGEKYFVESYRQIIKKTVSTINDEV